MSNHDIVLNEWETAEPITGYALTAIGRKLAERLTRTRSVEFLELVQGLKIRTTSFVGRISLENFTVTIRPKLMGMPLLNLLRYAYGLRHLHLFGPVDCGVTVFTFQDLLIQQLIAEIKELIVRGMHRNYERRSNDLQTPRGRLDFNRCTRVLNNETTLPCIEYPRIEDTLLNQVLLSGLSLAGLITADPELKAQIWLQTRMLSASVSAIRLDSAVMEKACRVMDRRTVSYEPSLQIIKILMRGQGLSLDEDSERVRLPGFLFDMNHFFQRLLSRFLHENLDEYEVEDETRLKGLFRYDPMQNPRRRSAPVQKPDFIVRRGRDIISVLDAKYRDLWEQPLPREMLYQVALYALGQSGDKRQAVILYPTMETAACEQTIIIQEPVGGVSQALLVLRPVNLLQLDELIRNSCSHASKQRKAYVKRLALGEAA